jgi:FkbM family methyltransferase
MKTVPVTINQKWTLQLLPHRDRGEWWDDWEQERLASMHDHLRPDDLVYYIGAEQGDMPALLASWGCRMVLVEPVAKVWPMIRATFEANQLPPPIASFVGFAGARDPERERWPHPEWPPQADLIQVSDFEGFAHLHERTDLPVIRLDTINDALMFAEAGVVAAIAMDVEGSELEVLWGAEGLLTVHRPLVWVSIHPDFMGYYGDTPDQLHDFMFHCGYDGELLANIYEEHWLFTPEERS